MVFRGGNGGVPLQEGERGSASIGSRISILTSSTSNTVNLLTSSDRGALSAGCTERGKRDVDCDEQIEKAVTAPNCMLKGSWGEGGSGGIRKKLKSEYAAYLESKYRRNDGSSI